MVEEAPILNSLIEKVWARKSQSFLKYGVMVEILLNMYSDVKGLQGFDPAVLTKHKNLLNYWKRVNKEHFDHMEKNYPEIYEEYLKITEKIESFFNADWYEISIEEALNSERGGTTLRTDRRGSVHGPEDVQEIYRSDQQEKR